MRRFGRAQRADVPSLGAPPDGTAGFGVIGLPETMAYITLRRPWLTEDELAAWFGNHPGTWRNLRTAGTGPVYYDIPGVGVIYQVADVMRWAGKFKQSATPSKEIKPEHQLEDSGAVASH